MADWSLPGVTNLYATEILPDLKGRDVDAITLCLVDPTNIPTGAIKWVRASSKFQEYNGASWDDKVLAIAGGGTGGATAASARTALGLGSISTQDNNAVNITGGTIGTAVNIDASRLTSGTIAQARLGTGSDGSGTHFLADDQTYKTPTSVPTGALAMWLTGVAPSGWIILAGGNISRTTYANLFALWGTTFGVGDGSTTFGIPDMRQRVPMGKAASGTGSGALGSTGGLVDSPVTVPAAGWTGVQSSDFFGGYPTQRLISSQEWPDSDGDFIRTWYTYNDRQIATINPPFIVVNYIVKT